MMLDNNLLGNLKNLKSEKLSISLFGKGTKTFKENFWNKFTVQFPNDDLVDIKDNNCAQKNIESIMIQFFYQKKVRIKCRKETYASKTIYTVFYKPKASISRSKTMRMVIYLMNNNKFCEELFNKQIMLECASPFSLAIHKKPNIKISFDILSGKNLSINFKTSNRDFYINFWNFFYLFFKFKTFVNNI